nr:acyltransferase family protein [Pyramidobacter sp.]
MGADETFTYDKTVRKIKHVAKILFFAVLAYLLFTYVFNVCFTKNFNAANYFYSKLQAHKILKLLLTNDPFVYGHLWFLYALIYCYVFSLFALDSPNKLTWAKILAPILLIGYSCLQEFARTLHITRSLAILGTNVTPVPRLWLFNLFIFRALPFFLFGVLFRHYRKVFLDLRVSYLQLVFVALLGGVLAIFEQFTFENSQFYIGSYVTVSALFILAVKNPDYYNKWLNHIGHDLSLYVYVLHIAVGQLLNRVIPLLGVKVGWPYFRAFLILALTLLVSEIIYRIARRFSDVRSLTPDKS